MPLLSARANKIGKRHIIENLGEISVEKILSIETSQNAKIIPKKQLRRLHWHPVTSSHFKMTGSYDGYGNAYGTHCKMKFTNIVVDSRKNSYIQYIPTIREFKVGNSGIYLINAHLHISIDQPNLKKITNAELFLKIHTPYETSSFSTFHLDFQEMYDIYGVTGEFRIYRTTVCLQGSTILFLSQDTNLSACFQYNIDTGGNPLDSTDSIWTSIDFSYIWEGL